MNITQMKVDGFNVQRIHLSPDVFMDFVKVPAGEFLMGAVEDDVAAEEDEKLQHRVYLDAYWIGRTPVTNAQYHLYQPDHKNWCGSNASDHPVASVAWQDAVSFCQWLSKKTGLSISLPTEAEWEKAARGTDGRTYPWGNEPPTPQLANYADHIGDTAAVGCYPEGASPYGALDMAGNVWEWVADWYGEDYYAVSPPKNPTGPGSGEGRVVRGGSSVNDEWYLRSSVRDWNYPGYALNDFGFRCRLSSES